MKKQILIIIALIVVGLLVFYNWPSRTPSEPVEKPEKEPTPTVTAENTLNFYNWTDYTPPELLQKFEDETGIKVVLDTYDSNETLLAKLQAGGANYDLVVPSQHFVEIMVKEGLLQKVGVSNMPNYQYVDAKWRNPSWDPEQEYSSPYQMGSASFAFRHDLYSGKGESLKEFFEPSEEVCGRLGVFKSPDEVITLAHLYLGTPFCSENPTEMQAVQDLLLKQKACVTAYSSEGQNDRLKNGDVIMHSHWDGYTHVGASEGIPLHYAYPKEGVVGWFDSLVVPVGAENVDNAKKFMNFLMVPENMAMLSNFASYANAIPDSTQYLDEALKSSQALNVPSEVPVKFNEACGEKAQKLMDRVWTTVSQ